MENAEEVFHFLEEFSKRKPKTIPQELNDYLAYVARTGDPVYQWSLVKCLFKEKLMTVITDFYETTPGIEIPPYPNVDPFNYDIMKNSLLERLDSFTSAPFTVQRICELLTYPRKQYNRIDKFMRAIEKNILVVSTREPGIQRLPEPDNGEPMEPVVNGSDNNSEYNVDVEMEDMSWKENTVAQNHSDPQPSSSDSHISVDDLATRLHAKQEMSNEGEQKIPPEASPSLQEVSDTSNSSPKRDTPETNDEVQKTENMINTTNPVQSEENTEVSSPKASNESNADTEMTVPKTNPEVVIPEIKINDAEMTEEKINENTLDKEQEEPKPNLEEIKTDPQEVSQTISQISSDESSCDSSSKEESEPKMTEVITSSEENSSSSDNTEGNSNSPKTEESSEETIKTTIDENSGDVNNETKEESKEEVAKSPEKQIVTQMQSDNYSISDVNSELPQIPPEKESKPMESEPIPPEESSQDENKEGNIETAPAAGPETSES